MDVFLVIESQRPWWQRTGPRRALAGINGALTALWLALLCFVVLPAALVASFFAAEVAFGITTPRETVQDFYSYADASFRAAPAGMMQVRTCDDPIPAGPALRDRYGDMPGCQHSRMISVSASQVIADQSATIEQFYWMLVGVSALALSGFYVHKNIAYISYRLNALFDAVIGRRRRIRP